MGDALSVPFIVSCFQRRDKREYICDLKFASKGYSSGVCESKGRLKFRLFPNESVLFQQVIGFHHDWDS